MTLPELIAALEGATVEQQDALIDRTLLFAERQGWITTNTMIKARRMLDAGAYESAALTLLPEGCLGMIKEVWSGTQKAGIATVQRYTASPRLMWAAGWDAFAATPALALSAAALKARGDAP